MQKKARLLKWGGVVIVLLGVITIAIAGSPGVAKADTTQRVCKLVWSKGGDGTVPLGLDQGMDPGLVKTLLDYNLQCSPTGVASCTLVPNGTDQNATLDLTSTKSDSPWIYTQLSGHYGLKCYATSAEDPGMNSPIKLICKLAWSKSDSVNAPLELSQVTDPGLVTTLQGAGLQCFPSGIASCALVPISAIQNATLDLTDTQKDSPWIYGQLSGHYGLECRQAV